MVYIKKRRSYKNKLNGYYGIQVAGSYSTFM
jgi:hypothetical protein